MTKKTRLHIVKVLETSTINELYEIKNIIKNPLAKNFGMYVGAGHYRHYQPTAGERLTFLKSTDGNDAPRGGQVGYFIKFNNTQANRDCFDFIKIYLTLI